MSMHRELVPWRWDWGNIHSTGDEEWEVGGGGFRRLSGPREGPATDPLDVGKPQPKPLLAFLALFPFRQRWSFLR